MNKVVGHTSLNHLLNPSKGKTISDWYNGVSGGLKRRLYLSYQIAMNFYILHRKNKAYCDISGNNILVAKDKLIASVCMIDIDNLYTPGCEKSGILGTLRYMAPEILNNQLPPDILTDDYSLAVIIFELLKCGHPYVGDFVDESSPEIEDAAYKGMLPYVDDEGDTMNKSSSMLPSDVVFNSRLKDLFEKTFVIGKQNRMSRVTSRELAIACLEASNALIKCQKCGAWYFPYPKIKKVGGYECPWCETANKMPTYLLFCERFPKYDDFYLRNDPSDKSLGIDKKTGKPCDYVPLKTFFLQEDELNIIPCNYTKKTFVDNDIVKEKSLYETEGNIKNSFTIKFRSASGLTSVSNIRKKAFIQNIGNEEIYIRRRNTGDYITLHPNQSEEISNSDAIYFDADDNWLKNFNYDNITNSSNSEVKTRIFAIYKSN
jgi:serine/threonine protein kinase